MSKEPESVRVGPGMDKQAILWIRFGSYTCIWWAHLHITAFSQHLRIITFHYILHCTRNEQQIHLRFLLSSFFFPHFICYRRIPALLVVSLSYLLSFSFLSPDFSFNHGQHTSLLYLSYYHYSFMRFGTYLLRHAFWILPGILYCFRQRYPLT